MSQTTTPVPSSLSRKPKGCQHCQYMYHHGQRCVAFCTVHQEYEKNGQRGDLVNTHTTQHKHI